MPTSNLLVRLARAVAAAIPLAFTLASHALADPGVATSQPEAAVSRSLVSMQSKSPAFASVSARSLLDEGGNITIVVPQARIDTWTRDLREGKTPVTLVPVRHLWIGECELAQNQDPKSAEWHFAQILQNQYASADLKGLARYDSAVALFYQGAYYKATSAFWKLLTGKTGAAHGVDKRRIALWYREASACAGYHMSRSQMGIPEPPQIDPKCAAAALAVCLRQLGLPYDEASVSKVCKVTGEGSSLNDILAAAKALGMTAHPFGSDDAGLIAAPKPLVTYVEHDHFIAVTGADKAGVTYLCSDCGPWPGGAVHLMWKQWHALEPSLYVAVSRPNSDTDKALTALVSGKLPALSKIAMVGPGKGILPKDQEWISVAHALQPHLIVPFRHSNPNCGVRVKSLHCPPYIHAPMVSGSGSNGKGCACGDPVNAATGEEEYSPEADLTVYNPNGPSVSWGRVYNSMRGEDNQTNTTDFGTGWSHNYNMGVLVPATGTPQGQPLVSSNGTVQLPAVGLEQPTTPGATWDIVNDNIPNSPEANSGASPVIASSLSPGGWSVSLSGSGQSAAFTVFVPGLGVGNGYRVRYVGAAGSGTGYSCPFRTAAGSGVLFSYDQDANGEFSRTSTGTSFTSDNEFVVLPNGSRISFVNPHGPLPALCTVDTGVPATVHIDSSGAYIINFPDQTQWVTSTTPNTLNNSAGSYYPVTQISGLTGSPINLNYSNLGGTGVPLLSSITSVATSTNPSATLLSISRDASGAINAVSDCYLRQVLYHVGSYAWTGTTKSSPELDAVSQVGQTGTTPPNRYSYGYGATPVLDANAETAPALHTITTPSENNGGATNMAIINYDPNTAFVSTIQDANGNVTSFTSVTAPGGTAVSSTTPSFCTQVAVSGTGSSYTYYLTYDGLMNQTGVTDGAGHLVQSMTYTDINDPYEASTVTNGNGRVWTYRWDAFGRPLLIYSQRPNSANSIPYHQYAFSYNTVMYSNVNIGTLDPYRIPLVSGISEDNKSGASFSYTTSSPPNLLKTYSYTQPSNTNPNAFVTASFSYDSQGNLAQIQQPTQNNSSGVTQYNTVTYSYVGTLNLLGRPYTMTDNTGKVWNMHYDPTTHDLLNVIDPNNNETQYTYDIANELQSMIAPATTQQASTGNATIAYSRAFPGADPYSAVVTDEAGSTVRQLLWSYGAEGELLASAGDAQPFTATYDMLYRLKTLADGSGNITKYFYNNAGYLYQIAYPGAGAGTSPLASGSRDTITYIGYDNDGNVTKRVDGRNNETDYAYADLEDNLSAITYPSAYSANNISYSYDANGRLQSENDAAGNTLAYGYDLDDDLASTTTTYAGLPAKMISYTYNFDFTRATMTTPVSGTAFQYSYDLDRRLNTLTNPQGQSFSWFYQNNGWVSGRSMSGANTIYVYWPDGSIRDIKTVLTSNTNTTLSEFANIKHDGAGNLKSMTALIPTHYPSNGLNSAYAYDAQGRLTQEAYTPSSSKGVTLNGTTGYVSAGNTTTGNFGTNDFSISVWVNVAASTGNNQVVVGKRGVTGQSSFFDLFVTADDHLAAEVDQDTSGTNYYQLTETSKLITYGAWHHLALVRQGAMLSLYVDGALAGSGSGAGTASISNSSALVVGSLVPYGTTYSLNGSVDELRLYPRALSLSEIQSLDSSSQVVNPPSGTWLYWDFEDNSGSEVFDPTAYGIWGDLTSGASIGAGCPAAGYKLSYVYDSGVANGAGNPTSFAGVSRTYNSDNQIVGVSYDNDGNPATAQGDGLSWDVEDRLTGITGQEAIGYRPDGLAGWQGSSSPTTYYLYDGDTPIEQLNSSGNITADYAYGPTGNVAYTNDVLNTLGTYLFDPLGNAIETLDSSGTATTHWQYPISGYGTVTSAFPSSLYYGAEHDPLYNGSGFGLISGTGLQQLGFRFYDPTTGRFLNRDPLGYGGGLNLYGYADDDPVNGIDPSGLDAWGYFKGAGAELGNSLIGTVFDAPVTNIVLYYGAKSGTLPANITHPFSISGCPDAQKGASDLDEALLEVGIADMLNPSGCFVAGTPIQMANGTTKSIEQVRSGDIIVSRDEKTGKTESKLVTNTIVHHDIPTIALTFSNGEKIVTTGIHPFYVKDKGFVPASQLVLGDAIITQTGPVAVIVEIEQAAPATVYNLTVDGDHTYFVGSKDGGLWVHNASCPPGQLQLPFKNLPAPAKTYHIYQIWNDTTGELYKFGQSGQAIRNGISLRAQSQVNALNRLGGEAFSSRVTVRGLTKSDSLTYERYLIRLYTESMGKRPVGNPVDR